MASSKTNRWKLGFFVLLGVVLAFATLLWLGTAQFRQQIFKFVTYVNESVQGLDVGAPVKFRGVAIGSVSNISIAKDREHVKIEMNIYVDRLVEIGLRPANDKEGQKPLPPELRVQLASAGITGVKYILVDFFDLKRNPLEKLPFELPAGEVYVPSVPSTMKSLEISVMEVLSAIPPALDRVSEMVGKIDKSIEAADIGGLSKDTRDTIHVFREKMDAVNARELGAKAEAALEEATSTLKELKRVAGEFDTRTQPMKELLTKIDSLALTIETAVKDAEMGPTAAAIRSAGTGVSGVTQGVSSITYDLDATLLSLRETAASLRRLANLLERDPQSFLFGKTPEVPPQAKKP